jgi:hypothetical protein
LAYIRLLLLTQFQTNPLSVLAKGIKHPSDVMENFLMTSFSANYARAGKSSMFFCGYVERASDGFPFLHISSCK